MSVNRFKYDISNFKIETHDFHFRLLIYLYINKAHVLTSKSKLHAKRNTVSSILLGAVGVGRASIF